jgi:DHA1 family bicyclomycin/chloramphenicol resistance-like MFS transporter
MPAAGTLPSDQRERGRMEFVLTTSVIMMLIALAIDAMLPALPQIGSTLGVQEANSRQWVITIFMIGFGTGQLVSGPVTDALGRKHVLLAALCLYCAASLAAAATTTIEMLLTARAVQGVAAAGARVVVVAMVRDRFTGEAMAQIMSFSQVVFMAAPVFAPLLGQAIVDALDWRWIFIGLGVVGLLLLVLTAARVEETLSASKRQSIKPRALMANWAMVLKDRNSRYFTLAGALLNIVFMGFLVSVQQIFADVIGNAGLLPYGFAIIAGAMAIASLVNGAIVKRIGMVRICRVAILAYLVSASCGLAASIWSPPSFALFVSIQASLLICSAFTGANLGALAMQNMGNMAGAATALQGSFSIAFGTLWGSVIGQMFDGSTIPLYASAVLCGSLATVIIYAVKPETGHRDS